MKLWSSISDWFRVVFAAQTPKQNTITLTNDGLAFMVESEVLFSLVWKDVREIVVYKEDMFGCDSICIAFRLSEADEYVRVFEEAEGYEELMTELQRRFPGIRQDWFHEVAFPAFVPNWTTIWGTPFPPATK